MNVPVLVGRVIGVFGLRGEVKVAAPAFDIAAGTELVARASDGTTRRLRVERVRPARGHSRVRFAGVADLHAAQSLRGMSLLAAPGDLPPLPANSYRESELIGMRVVDATLGPLGTVGGVAHYPGSDMLIVGEQRTLVPMLAAFGMRIDRVQRTVNTSLPAGFEELL